MSAGEAMQKQVVPRFKKGKDKALVKFEPRKAKIVIAGLKAAASQAAKMKAWAESDESIEALIDWQAAMVAWWRVTTPSVGGDRQSSEGKAYASNDAHALTHAEKQRITGFVRQQIDRWEDRLENREAYRVALRKALQTVAYSRDPKREPQGDVPEIERRYRTIVVDPPWPMKKIERVVAPNQTDFDYETQSIDQIKKLVEVIDGARAESCHMFLWTTERFLPAAKEVLEAWGFPYMLTMVWHKDGGFQPVGLPQFNCEFVLYSRLGAPSFLETTNFFCCFTGKRRGHSRKPIEFYDLLRRVTDGPRLDMFSREPHEGFDQWGDQVGMFADGEVEAEA